MENKSDKQKKQKNTMKGKNNKKTALINEQEAKKAPRQVVYEGVVQVGALRGQIGANGAHRGRKAKIS